ncbi:hypothetical protein NDU88_006514 [Pleurodeles waltl]|uniref:Uncharacterized protein n=1 Tax=Pleurodeles waltl TaxID=8319 RepID=A0AAV7SPR6_PLEWA|nr:hypothetical protein NDU88_006514 [Pleurodeles waltl]
MLDCSPNAACQKSRGTYIGGRATREGCPLRATAFQRAAGGAMRVGPHVLGCRQLGGALFALSVARDCTGGVSGQADVSGRGSRQFQGMPP